MLTKKVEGGMKKKELNHLTYIRINVWTIEKRKEVSFFFL